MILLAYLERIRLSKIMIPEPPKVAEWPSQNQQVADPSQMGFSEPRAEHLSGYAVNQSRLRRAEASGSAQTHWG